MAAQGDESESTDTALIAGCRRGDSASWEALVRRYQRLVYSIPIRAGLGEEAAADVFQQVFITLFEKLDTLEQPERIAAWLTTTARRESWRVGRRSRAAGSSLSIDIDEETLAIPDEAPLPNETVERIEAQHAIRLAVEALDERCRELLKLLFYSFEPPPYVEIAARLGVAEGSIGPTRARCLQKLRKRIEAA